MRRFPPRTLILMFVALGAFAFMYWRTAAQRGVWRDIQAGARDARDARGEGEPHGPGAPVPVACLAAERWLQQAARGMEVGVREGLIALEACQGPPTPGLCEAGRRALAVWGTDGGSARAGDLRAALCVRCGGCGEASLPDASVPAPSPAPDAGARGR